jgi:hypothetical protein
MIYSGKNVYLRKPIFSRQLKIVIFVKYYKLQDVLAFSRLTIWNDYLNIPHLWNLCNLYPGTYVCT